MNTRLWLAALGVFAALLCVPQISSAAGQVPEVTASFSTDAATRAASISGPVIAVMPPALAFGYVMIGQTATRSLSVSNNGAQSLLLTDCLISNSHFTSSFVGPITIPAGGSTTLLVSYHSIGPSMDSATLTLVSNALNDPLTVPVSGSGVPDAGPSLGAGRILVAPTGESAGDQFGVSVGPAGDLNGDGYDDFLVGGWANDAGGSDAGRAYVYFGGASPNDIPDRILQGTGEDSNFGTSVASAGDVNGDGFPDVVVGAWRNSQGGADAGRAFVYFGGPGMDAVADLTLTGEGAGDRFGVSVSSAGDVNGDGYSDVVVGAFLSDAGGLDAGRAYVFFGGPGADGLADWVLTGAAANDNFGFSVAGVRDVNGDGYGDVLAAALGNDAGGPEAGRAYVYFGGVSPNSTPDWILTGTTPGARFGVRAGAAGDVNGDGFPDLIVGADAHFEGGPGQAFVFYGGPIADAIADLTLAGEPGFLGFGAAVSSAGDANGDGFDDLLVGAWLNSAQGALAGRAYLYYGGTSADEVADVVFTGEAPGDRLGGLVAPAGDVDGDGRDDFILGAYFNDDFADDAGRAYVVSLAETGSNSAPMVTAPAAVFSSEGVLIAFSVHASDPDGDHVTLGILGRPVGALFVDLGDNSGNFSWTPGFNQAGSYAVSFTGRDERGAEAAPRPVSIMVGEVNRGPTAAPGGPYTGVIGVPIAFDGTGSSDPDGNALTHQWNFGDLGSASGPNPLHAYATGGFFTVELTVGDGSISASASTTASVQDVFPATAFLQGGNITTRLNSGKARTCVQIEPVSRAYLNTSVSIGSIVMISAGTGSVDRIPAIANMTTIGSDGDRNGVEEITACFAKTDLRSLFSGLSGGHHTVAVVIEGALSTGGRFSTTLEMDVVASGNVLDASVSPNPLNPAGTLTFRTTVPGSVTIKMFDPAGRLVRTVLNESHMPPGYHDAEIDGRRDDGAKLSSGVYFYRVESANGISEGRIVILK